MAWEINFVEHIVKQTDSVQMSVLFGCLLYFQLITISVINLDVHGFL